MGTKRMFLRVTRVKDKKTTREKRGGALLLKSLIGCVCHLDTKDAYWPLDDPSRERERKNTKD